MLLASVYAHSTGQDSIGRQRRTYSHTYLGTATVSGTRSMAARIQNPGSRLSSPGGTAHIHSRLASDAVLESRDQRGRQPPINIRTSSIHPRCRPSSMRWTHLGTGTRRQRRTSTCYGTSLDTVAVAVTRRPTAAPEPRAARRQANVKRPPTSRANHRRCPPMLVPYNV